MAPKPEQDDDITTQLRDLHLSIATITQQQEDFKNFLSSQLPMLIKDQVSTLSLNRPSSSADPQPTIKIPKITLSSFDGKDPLDWIFKAQNYFDLSNTPPAQRLILIPFFLQGPALGWFKWLHSNHLLTTWDDFLHALEVRFGPSSFTNHEADLYKLTQTSTVLAYQQQFESLSNRVAGLSPQSLLNCFLSGLRKEIHHELTILKPSSLIQAIDLAKLVEDKLTAQRLPANRPFKPPNLTSPTTPPASQPSILGSPPPLPIRRLSYAEQQERRAKGLCFNCDDKFQKGHRCNRDKQFLFFFADEAEGEGSGSVVVDTGPTVADLLQEAADPGAISLSPSSGEHFQLSQAALMGPPSPRTLRVQGRVRELEVTILVDSGSSHNILQPRVAEFLGLPMVAIPAFSVIVGNGDTITCNGLCESVPVRLADEVFHIPFFILPIHGADLVLGVQWLQTLGSFLSDYSVPSIQFTHNNKPITLIGNPPASPTLATYSQFCRFIFTDAIVSAHTVTITELTPPSESPHHPDITHLLNQYSPVFSKPVTLPPHRTQNHHIHLLPNSKPVNIRPYRYPQYQKDVMTTMIREMLADGIIRPSTSPFSSPVLLVRKKDGTWRFCVDYRALNAVTVKDRFPIPTIDELLDELHGAKVFSKLDLRSGYHQILVAPEDCFKTAFRTIDGHFEFCVMPFGLSNAPSTFQATMNDVFSAFLRKFVLVFFDDILIYSPTWESHLDHLHQVLEVLLQQKLFAKLAKCEFAVPRISYLGHIISSAGVEADPEKLLAIQAWPAPTSVSALRGFLGLTGFYRRFVQNYATIAGPLTDLLKHHAFSWTTAAMNAFQALKTAMTTLPVLGIPDFSVVFDVTTDASGVAIGAVLSQQAHPIAFFSQKLCPRMSVASAYEREMFAITAAVKKWRHYLLGRHFRIFTDQQSLRGLFAQTIQTPAQHKWLTKLLGFDYEIHYTPGRANVVADALSRRAETSEALFCSITENHPLILDLLREFYASHPTGLLLASKFQHPQNHGSAFCFKQGLLFHKERLFIPLETDLRPKLLTEFHTTPVGGHSGVKGTLARLTSAFTWPHISRDVKAFIQACTVCQQHKYSTQRPYGLLHPLPIPHQVWEDIAMDFVTHLPPAQGKTVIWVVIDRLTKYAHFIALPTHYSAVSLASLFMSEIYRLHGLPKSIVSDRDRIFVSRFWKELFTLSGTTLCFSSAYHPQTDGQTEVTNRILETFLRCFVSDTPKQWVSFLPLAEHWYNSSYQSAIGMTPFQALYGRCPPNIRTYVSGDSQVATLDEILIEHHRILGILKANLQRAQQRMVSQANTHRQDRIFQEGDWVWLRLQPYRQVSVRQQRYSKFTKRYHGPFQILRRIGTVAYELQLPSGARIHPVFHVSKLKEFHGNPPDTLPTLDAAVEGTMVPLVPSKILGYRTLHGKKGGIRQVLVQWDGVSELEATWEDTDHLKEAYPEVNLEDKVELDGMGNDTGVSITNSQSPNEPKEKSPKVKRKRNAPTWLKDYHVPGIRKTTKGKEDASSST
ncbi:hypothetical protein QL285_035697 [Trifolium repens]|nr:hypothetical protein QL285_067932 [Trifolium repens]KAK2425453.1 hypothetical protein QL285_035697 [Trifolium repens]